MKVHCCYHVPFEGLAAIASVLATIPVSISETHFYADNWCLPDINDVDAVIIMGGPMGVFDDAHYPWLVDEKCWLTSVIAADKPVLGICLGAQLLAHCLGAQVHTSISEAEPALTPEMGWWPIYPAEEAADHPYAWLAIEAPQVFHWHGDRFDTPPGATRLAYSPVCPNQAFVWQNRCVGLQYHLEMTPEAIASLLAACAEDLQPQAGKIHTYIQPQLEIEQVMLNKAVFRAAQAERQAALSKLIKQWLGC